jgi:hypothetical protein
MTSGHNCYVRGDIYVKGKGIITTYFVKTPFDSGNHQPQQRPSVESVKTNVANEVPTVTAVTAVHAVTAAVAPSSLTTATQQGDTIKRKYLKPVFRGINLYIFARKYKIVTKQLQKIF